MCDKTAKKKLKQPNVRLNYLPESATVSTAEWYSCVVETESAQPG
jgi:hypothetical protein